MFRPLQSPPHGAGSKHMISGGIFGRKQAPAESDDVLQSSPQCKALLEGMGLHESRDLRALLSEVLGHSTKGSERDAYFRSQPIQERLAPVLQEKFERSCAFAVLLEKDTLIQAIADEIDNSPVRLSSSGRTIFRLETIVAGFLRAECKTEMGPFESNLLRTKLSDILTSSDLNDHSREQFVREAFGSAAFALRKRGEMLSPSRFSAISFGDSASENAI